MAEINQDGVRDHRSTPYFAKAAMSIAWPSFSCVSRFNGSVFPQSTQANWCSLVLNLNWIVARLMGLALWFSGGFRRSQAR